MTAAPSSPRPLKIGLVVNLFPSVSETFIFNKARGLAARGHEVVVFSGGRSRDVSFYRDRLGAMSNIRMVQRIGRDAPRRSITSLVQAVTAAPSRALSLLLHCVRRFGARRGLRNWLRVLPIATQDLDLVHFEFSGIAVLYQDVLPLINVPVVVSCRGTAEQVVPLVNAPRRAALGSVLNQVARVHCVSTDMVATVARWGVVPQKTFVNRPAIDPALFTRRERHETGPTVRIISVGRLHWDKGFAYALQAVAEVRRRGIPVEYTIVGNGPDRSHLVYTADCLGLGTAVHFAGAKSSADVRALIEAADVFLLPTVREGISNACLEAMALEMPVISTTTGGMAEVITHGVDGCLVPPRDPAAMAGELARLAQDPAERRQLGAAARARIAEHFTLDRQIDVFESEYEHLVATTPR